jgi:hypothetical protein
MSENATDLVAPVTGRRVLICRDADDDAEAVEIRAPDGRIELRIRLTDEGPVLCLDAVRLQLAAEEVAVSCDRFAVDARSAVEMHTQGEYRQRSHGDATVQSRGDLRLSGQSTELGATFGELRLHANDDVRVNGERVRLNC